MKLTKKDIIYEEDDRDILWWLNVPMLPVVRLREVLNNFKDSILERDMSLLNNDFCEGYRTAQQEIHNNFWNLFAAVLEKPPKLSESEMKFLMDCEKESLKNIFESRAKRDKE